MVPTPELAAALRSVLERHPEVELALLFGSRARGAAGARSDLDLAVEGAAIDRLQLARELSAATGLEVDLVELRQAGYPLLKSLLRDSVVVHEGSPHAAARFRTRAILVSETDRPWFERMRNAYLDGLARRADGRS